jgi:hypothetical protein
MNEEFERGLDGVTFARRKLVVAMTACSMAIYSASLSFDLSAAPSAIEPKQPPGKTLRWKSFLSAAQVLASALVAQSDPNEPLYIQKLGQLLIRSRRPPESRMTLMPGEPYLVDATSNAFPLTVITIQMAAGTVIPLHDHRAHNALLQITSGEVEVGNFEIVEPGAVAKNASTFRIRRTRIERLKEGHISGLTRTMDNIHYLKAGARGAVLVDCLTQFDGRPSSVYLDVGSASPGYSIELEARWRNTASAAVSQSLPPYEMRTTADIPSYLANGGGKARGDRSNPC